MKPKPTFRDYQAKRDAAAAIIAFGVLVLVGSLILLLYFAQWADWEPRSQTSSRWLWGVDVWLHDPVGTGAFALGGILIWIGCGLAQSARRVKERLDRDE